MFSGLEATENRFEEIEMKLSDPEILADQQLYTKYSKEYSSLEELVREYRKYKEITKGLDDIKEMQNEQLDKEMRELIQVEYAELKEQLEEVTETLKILLIPKDPNDDKNVIIEIRAGAGGEEAALFAANLYRAYSMYAESRGWPCEILDSNATEIGGFKEVVFTIEATGAYSRFKFESGVHRVQRVPDTESSGRIHTSTITVAVLPEADELDEITINPSDLQIDTYRASGAGGQHINKTDSAIRITHLPTGIVVTCQDQRSQHKNKDKAMRVLQSKLNEIAQREATEAIAGDRKNQVGTGDRSERIRTYNYPQGRVTDHRIGLTLYKLPAIMNGDLDEIIDALITSDRAGKLGSGDADND